MEKSCRQQSFRKKKKQPPSLPWDKSRLASAIPPKLTSFDVHSLHVPSYVPRWITGGNPSTSTEELSFPFKPPSKVHSTDASGSAHTNQNSLYIRSLCLLLFLIGLICFLICFSILNHLSFVNSKMKNFLIQNDLI